MYIYLAGRYSRRLELCGYREKIHAIGHRVQAQWLDGEHQLSDAGVPIGESGESLVEGNLLRSGERISETELAAKSAALRQQFAKDDFRDVICCDLLIHFTEWPRSKQNRGGRHVEFGMALGLMKKVWIVGPRENIFCWLEEVRHFDTFEACLHDLPLLPSADYVCSSPEKPFVEVVSVTPTPTFGCEP